MRSGEVTIRINPGSTKTGYINYNGFAYAVTIGNPQVTQSRLVISEDRGFLNYDTGNAIPSQAIIKKVELYHSLINASPPPTDWKTDLHMGTFIGAALDAADWSGGTHVLLVDWSLYCVGNNPCSTFIDLGAAGIKSLNRIGETDIRLTDNSLYQFGDPASWTHSLWGSAAGRSSYLKVTVWLPPGVFSRFRRGAVRR